MTRRLESALRRLRHLRGQLVFCHEEGSAVNLWHLRGVLRRSCRLAGLREIRWHDLRHSFASQCVSAGVPLRQVQAWLGHGSLTMTLPYAHLAPGDGDQRIRALEEPVVATAWQREGERQI